MPIRKTPLINGEIYHIISRGINSQPIFLDPQSYHRAIKSMLYYQNPYNIRFSHLIRLKNNLNLIKEPYINILCYCFMPNHLHLLVKQIKNNGISTFMRNFLNSYGKYTNIKHKRTGPLFEGRFKAIRIETDNQLIHVSRYIHLNPYSSYIIKSKAEILDYPYSSIKSYLNIKSETNLNTVEILSHFSIKQTYKNFLMDQADYQQTLNHIKHLSLE